MIFVTLSTFAEYDETPLRKLRESGIPVKVHSTGKRIATAELLQAAPGVTAVIAGVEPYDDQTLAAMPDLRLISRVGVGVDAVDLAAARKRGVAVVNTPDPPTHAVAELALTMMLALSRNLPRQIAAARAHEWRRLEAHLLGARRVGIIGLGRIGRRVAQLVRAFGCEVWAADPAPDAAWATAHGVRLVTLTDLLTNCDVISIHAARSSGTPLVLGASEFALMRRGAMVINLGRGDMIDEPALHDAIASGHLAGAGLDVYRSEPYDGPLCDLDSVVLTPHTATLTVETRSAMELEAVEKTLAFLAGTLPMTERVV